MKFSINDFFSKCDQICSFLQFPADLVTFPEEILNGKLHFLPWHQNLAAASVHVIVFMYKWQESFFLDFRNSFYMRKVVLIFL